MPNPYLIIVVIIAWLGSAWWWGDGQREEGRREERGVWQARDNKALADANRALADAQKENTRLKAEHEERIAAIATNIVQEDARHEANLRRAVRNARSLVLRQQPRCPSADQAGGGQPAGPGAAPGGSDAAGACELPEPSVRDLLQLVGDADRAVRRLAACQATVTEYYRYAKEACGQPPPNGGSP